MMHYILKRTLIVFALLLFQTDCCWGSGGSIISAGAFGGYNGDETGHRQLVRLQPSGDIFSAMPQNSPIRLITMHAPGLKDGHLIIRELKLPDAQKSILISAPKNIQSHIKRATIYLSSASKDVLFYQQLESGWERLEPIRIITSGHLLDQDVFDDVWACSVSHFGHFRLLYQPMRYTDSVAITEVHKAGIIPMGSVNKGVFPWICAGILFMTIGVLSYFIHKVECKGAN